ncbi:septum formation protein [Marinoscillum furvescens DSM 4134]|uniref:dTTP/UTP pyrophosphatase n=1 Tax=Marinoscillum furvescens DSM 4134 TaxID=1122208 RepID=A0A3D9L090_MARFU|nr:septum formation protein [Marinoscillum furvescens DSM 4134]
MILASNSPRRQQLLREAGFEFEVFVRDFPEDFPGELPADEVAQYLAVQKNENYRPLLPDALILTADTTVILGDRVMNKPANADEAREMLTSLSNKTHEVICGVCISSASREISFSDRTEVTFGSLSPAEIDHYITTFQPFDKAGAYGIQEWIGMTKIIRITGSYYNVMGLPTHKVYEALMGF